MADEEQDDLTPQPRAWPKCPTCDVSWVLRRSMTFGGGALSGYQWLWQRDCKHKAQPIVATTEGDS